MNGSYSNLEQSAAQCSVAISPAPGLSNSMLSKQKLQRVSVGLSDGEYAELLALSQKHRVSLAWLGRQAIIEFMGRYRNQELQLPLTLGSRERKVSNG